MGGINEMGKELAHIDLEIWQNIQYIQKAKGNINLDDQTESMPSVGNDAASAANITAVCWLHYYNLLYFPEREKCTFSVRC